jgi:ATP-dependent protease Clp ATPase subunit
VETIIMDEMYEIPSKKVKELVITKKMAQTKLEKANLSLFATT